MKALRFHTFGPPSVLAIEEVATPQPGPGEVVVRVKAAGLNPADLKNVSGHFHGATLPRTPGRDGAGVVVGGNRQGEEVWFSAPGFGISHDGVQAEYAAVPEIALSRKPASLTMEQAAAIGVPFTTAWAALIGAANLQAGETVLIVGAAGAVGQAGVQIANWKGARVLGAARGSRPIRGITGVIDTTAGNLSERVLAVTGGNGADVVFDTVGGPLFEPALRCLRHGGRQIAIASTGDSKVTFNLVDFYHTELHLIGLDSNALSAKDVGDIAEKLRPGFESGILIPPDIEPVAFDNAVEAYLRLAAGAGGKKYVLTLPER